MIDVSCINIIVKFRRNLRYEFKIKHLMGFNLNNC